MEPWDGPASIAFTDGRKIGAVLDRNGLRPSRYVVTKDGFVVMASEVGVLDIRPSGAAQGAARAGQDLLRRSREGRIVEDEEIKARYKTQRPYRSGSRANRCCSKTYPGRGPSEVDRIRRCASRCSRSSATPSEDLKFLLAPMAAEGKWPIGSMGEDEALACLSDRPRLLYHYFKQLFAQVTNPAMDSINERTGDGALLDPRRREEPARRDARARAALRCNIPILTDEETRAHPRHRPRGFPEGTYPPGALQGGRWGRRPAGRSRRAVPRSRGRGARRASAS
jgi:glutamate synthase (NADPH) large chain